MRGRPGRFGLRAGAPAPSGRRLAAVWRGGWCPQSAPDRDVHRNNCARRPGSTLDTHLLVVQPNEQARESSLCLPKQSAERPWRGTEYVAAVYAEMRADEAAAQMPHSYTTARTLLSILRLSQALARLRFAASVAQARPWAPDPNPPAPEPGAHAAALCGQRRAGAPGLLTLTQPDALSAPRPVGRSRGCALQPSAAQARTLLEPVILLIRCRHTLSTHRWAMCCTPYLVGGLLAHGSHAWPCALASIAV